MDINLTGTDRRGLGEIVTWTSVFVILGILNLAYMVLSAKHGEIKMDPVLLGALTGAVTAIVARGTQGASERSGSSEALNLAASQLRQIVGEMRAAALQPSPVAAVVTPPHVAAPSSAPHPLGDPTPPTASE